MSAHKDKGKVEMAAHRTDRYTSLLSEKSDLQAQIDRALDLIGALRMRMAHVDGAIAEWAYLANVQPTPSAERKRRWRFRDAAVTGGTPWRNLDPVIAEAVKAVLGASPEPMPISEITRQLNERLKAEATRDVYRPYLTWLCNAVGDSKVTIRYELRKGPQLLRKAGESKEGDES